MEHGPGENRVQEVAGSNPVAPTTISEHEMAIAGSIAEGPVGAPYPCSNPTAFRDNPAPALRLFLVQGQFPKFDGARYPLQVVHPAAHKPQARLG